MGSLWEDFTEVPRQGLTEKSEGQAGTCLGAEGTAGTKALKPVELEQVGEG